MVEQNGDSKLPAKYPPFPNVATISPALTWAPCSNFPEDFIPCHLELPNANTALSHIIAQREEASVPSPGLLPFSEDYWRKNSCIGWKIGKCQLRPFPKSHALHSMWKNKTRQDSCSLSLSLSLTHTHLFLWGVRKVIIHSSSKQY